MPRRSGGGNRPGRRSQPQQSPHQSGVAFASGVSPPTIYRAENLPPNEPCNVFPSAPYTSASDLFMSQALRQQFQPAGAQPASVAPPKVLTVTTVASPKFSHYTSIVNIEPQGRESCCVSGATMQLYRTTNRFNGKHVVLRRVINSTTDPMDCAATFDKLRHFRHPNLVPLHSVTPTQEFVLGSNDVIVEYRLIRGAKSLAEGLFAQADQPSCTEALLWSIACQLVGLMRHLHEADVSLRCLHHSKLLYVEAGSRIYFSGLGLVDLCCPNAARESIDQQRTVDIRALGLVLLQLALRNLNATVADFVSLDRMPTISRTFLTLVDACLQAKIHVAELCRALGERLTMEVGHQQGIADLFLSECGKEVHNGRLMKLLMKLNFVIGGCNDLSNEWSDSGEKFPLRLFFNYLFNQVDENNRPRVDWGHVYHALNKLDSGSEDLVQLISMDGSNSYMFVVSYRDLKQLAEKAFDSLLMQAEVPTTPPQLFQMASVIAANAPTATTPFATPTGAS